MSDDKKVKIRTDYPCHEKSLSLWGVLFTAKEVEDGSYYVAEVDAETAKSLIDAKRAIKDK